MFLVLIFIADRTNGRAYATMLRWPMGNRMVT